MFSSSTTNFDSKRVENDLKLRSNRKNVRSIAADYYLVFTDHLVHTRQVLSKMVQKNIFQYLSYFHGPHLPNLKVFFLNIRWPDYRLNFFLIFNPLWFVTGLRKSKWGFSLVTIQWMGVRGLILSKYILYGFYATVIVYGWRLIALITQNVNNSWNTHLNPNGEQRTLIKGT